MGHVKSKGKNTGTLKSDKVKPVWLGRVPKSNISRIMTGEEARLWSLSEGRSIFTKLKKWELDQL